MQKVTAMLSLCVSDELSLELLDDHHAEGLFRLTDENRNYSAAVASLAVGTRTVMIPLPS
jgi:hypothetical protein